MIICLHFIEREPGYPSCDLLIPNKQLTRTGAAQYVDVNQAAGADDKEDRNFRDGIDR